MQKMLVGAAILSVLSGTAFSQTAAIPPQTGLSLETGIQLLGVDTNLNDTGGQGLYASFNDVKSALAYLGVNQIRNGLPSNAHGNFQSYQEAAYEENLAVLGYQFTLVFSDYTLGIAFERAQLDTLFAGVGGEFNGAAMPAGAIRIVEGLNEINNEYPQPSIQQAAAWQSQIFCLTRQALFCPANSVDRNVAGSAVATFTSNGPVVAAALPSAVFAADLANNHPYIEPSNNYHQSVLATIQNADQSVFGFLPRQLNAIAGVLPSAPAGISTESGAYYEPYAPGRTDLQYLNGFDLQTMAIKDVDSVLDSASLGQQSFLYQLFDNYETTSNYGTDSDNRYGLFVATGSTDGHGNPGYTPTPAAIAIHDFVTLLGAPGFLATTRSNNCLLHTISGLPAGASSLMFKLDDSGDYAIVLWWDNPLDWNKDIHKPVAVTAAPVTITLADPAQGNVFDPMTGTRSILSYGPTTAIPVSLGDDPLLVELHTLNPNERCN